MREGQRVQGTGAVEARRPEPEAREPPGENRVGPGRPGEDACLQDQQGGAARSGGSGGPSSVLFTGQRAECPAVSFCGGAGGRRQTKRSSDPPDIFKKQDPKGSAGFQVTKLHYKTKHKKTCRSAKIFSSQKGEIRNNRRLIKSPGLQRIKTTHDKKKTQADLMQVVQWPLEDVKMVLTTDSHVSPKLAENTKKKGPR